jgi:hypothetical protein
MIERYHEPILQNEMTHYLTWGNDLDYSKKGHPRWLVHHIKSGLNRLNNVMMGYGGDSSGFVESDSDGLQVG